MNPELRPDLRPTGPADLPDLHALSVEAGWPHRLEDWRFAAGFGRGVAARDPTGRIGGCAMWWPFGEAGSVGLVIVRPSCQGRGIGRRLMRAVFAEAGPRRWSLTATRAGRRLYESEGFVAGGPIHQRQGVALPPPGAADPRVRPMVAADRAAILALDRAASGADRGRMLDALAAVAEGHVVEDAAGVAGFAFTRRFGRGHTVGPVVAADDAGAVALLRPALETHQSTFLRVDTPVADGALPAFLDAAGLAEVDVALAMTRGDAPPQAGPARLYGLASQALG